MLITDGSGQQPHLPPDSGQQVFPLGHSVLSPGHGIPPESSDPEILFDHGAIGACILAALHRPLSRLHVVPDGQQ